jgi:glycosyltransferase involved in cell wall biosynthesis
VLRAIPASDIILTNTFWIPMLLRNRKRGRLYVHVARFPKGQMRSYKHAARLQAPSRSVAEAIVAEVPTAAARVIVVPYPRPQTHSSDSPTFTDRSDTVLYVGRVHPEKGVHLLVEAFAGLPQELRDQWKLDIVGPVESRFGGGGDNYQEELNAKAATASARIQFRGPIFDAAELERAFRSAALFVYPSLADKGETFGLAPLEAMTHGCPVLVSDLGCFHDFVSPGETGFMFDHRSANPSATLRAKLEESLRERAQLARVGETGYRVSEEYTLERVARRFLTDFEAVVAESYG